MKELPNEIVAAIANNLTFADELQFAHVCKSWFDGLSRTTLYNKLAFKNLEHFNQAKEFFNKKGYIKQRVRHLGIFDMGYDMQLVVALPLLFPKTTSLEWKNESRHEFVDPEERDESTYDQALQQWKDI